MNKIKSLIFLIIVALTSTFSFMNVSAATLSEVNHSFRSDPVKLSNFSTLNALESNDLQTQQNESYIAVYLEEGDFFQFTAEHGGFTLYGNTSAVDSSQGFYTLTAPSGGQALIDLPSSDPGANFRSMMTIQASETGVHLIKLHLTDPENKAYYLFNNLSFNVESNAGVEYGRIWFNNLQLAQDGEKANLDVGDDFTFYHVTDMGYIYKQDLIGYNGLFSSVSSSAAAIVTTGLGDIGGVANNNCKVVYNDIPIATSFYNESINDIECATRINLNNLFLNEPASIIPEKVNIPSVNSNGEYLGSTKQVIGFPKLADIKIEAGPVTLTSESAYALAGTISVSITGISGTVTLHLGIDTNGDSIIDSTKSLSLLVNQNGATTYTWDGKDDFGISYPASSRIVDSYIHVDKLGETHFKYTDVEVFGKQLITRVNNLDNKPAEPVTLHYDSSQLPIDMSQNLYNGITPNPNYQIPNPLSGSYVSSLSSTIRSWQKGAIKYQSDEEIDINGFIRLRTHYRFENYPGKTSPDSTPGLGYSFDVENRESFGDGNVIVDVTYESADLKIDVLTKIIAPDVYSIGDSVFNDLNEDGIMNNDEKGVQGVTVELYQLDSLEQTISLLKPFRVLKTNRNGQYIFNDLKSGLYAVSIVYDKALFEVSSKTPANTSEFEQHNAATQDAVITVNLQDSTFLNADFGIIPIRNIPNEDMVTIAKSGELQSIDNKKIEYKIMVTNHEDHEVTNYVVKDDISTELSLNGDSLKLGLDSYSNEASGNSIKVTIPAIAANGTAMIKFETTIITFPKVVDVDGNGIINNNADLYNVEGKKIDNDSSIIKIPPQKEDQVIIVSSVDNVIQYIGGELKYTINIYNSSDHAVSNYVVNNIIPLELDIISTSLKLNNVLYSNGVSGNTINIVLPTIGAKDRATITFTTIITAQPVIIVPDVSGNRVTSNTATLYNYENEQVDRATVTTLVPPQSDSIIKLEKEVDSNFANVGDNLIYTITVTNTSEHEINNYVVKDLVPKVLEIDHSMISSDKVNILEINGNLVAVIIPSLLKGESTTIKITAKIISFPINRIIDNSVTLYNVDGGYVTKDNSTTTVLVPKSNEVEIKKNVDKEFARVGDELTYEIIVSNNTLEPIKDYVVKDFVPETLFLVPNSLLLDSQSYNSVNANYIEIVIPLIEAQSSVTIKFKVSIINFKDTDAILTSSSIYNPTDLVNPVGEAYAVTDKIIDNVIIEKKVAKEYAINGDIINYELNVTNNGTTDIHNYIITDEFDSNITTLNLSSVMVVPSSAFIDISTINLLQVVIPKIAVGESIKVTFNVNVEQFPESGVIHNYAQIIDPNYPDNPIISNKVVTKELTDRVLLNKTVNKVFAVVGDTVEYTIEVINNSNTELNNYFVSDVLDPNLLKLNASSVKVNSSTKVIRELNGNNFKVTIPSIVAKETIVITYTAEIISFDRNGKITNLGQIFDPGINGAPVADDEVVIEEVLTSAILSKSVDKEFAIIGDTITYTIEVINNSNVALNNYYIIDELDDQLEKLDSNSIKIKGVIDERLEINGNKVKVTIPILNVSQKVTITFNVTILAFDTQGQVLTVAKLFNSSNTGMPVAEDEVSIKEELANTIISTRVDKEFAVIGDTLTYTIEVTNNSKIAINNYYVTDELDAQLVKLDASSIKVDGITGIDHYVSGNDIKVVLPILNANQVVTITFTVNILAFNSNGQLLNVAQLYAPSSAVVPVYEDEIIVKEDLTNVIIRQRVDKEFAIIGDRVEYTIEVVNNSNVIVNNYYLSKELDTRLVKLDVTSVKINVEPDIMPEVNENNIKVYLPTLNRGQIITITFTVDIIAFDTSGEVRTGAQILNPRNPEQPVAYDEVVVTEEIAELVIRKGVNKEVSIAGDTLEYTIEIINKGKTSLKNYYLIDELDSSLVKVNASSIKVNGITGATPEVVGNNIKVVFPKLSSKQKVIITFKAEIITFDKKGEIQNSVQIFDPKNPNAPVADDEITTYDYPNDVIVLTKVDKETAVVGDTLKYTIEVINGGNTAIDNYFLIEEFDVNLVKLNANTIKVNGVDGVKPVLNEKDINITFDTLSAGQRVTITFTVNIIAFDEKGLVVNIAQVFDPSNPGTPVTKDESTTKKESTKVVIKKMVDTEVAVKGDTLEYTIEVTNNSLESINNYYVIDNLNSKLVKLDRDSIKINGAEDAYFEIIDSSIKVTIPTLTGGQSAIINFNVEIVAFDSNGEISNLGQVFDPENQDIAVDGDKVITQEHNANVTVEKLVDKEYAVNGDILTFTVEITNNTDKAINNYYVINDLDFKKVKLNVDSIRVIGRVDVLQDITESTIRVTFPTLSAKQKVSIIFMVEIVSFDSSGVIANSVQVYNPNNPNVAIDKAEVIVKEDLASVIISKKVDKDTAVIGDTLEYTIEVINNSNKAVSNYYVSDNIAEQFLELDDNSLKVIGIKNATTKIVNNTIKVTFPTIEAGLRVIITFQGKVINFDTNGNVLNTAQIFDSNYPNNPIDEETSTTKLDSSHVVLRKMVDKGSAIIGDTIEYTIEVINNSTTTLKNYYVIDKLDEKLVKLDVSSITISGVGGITPEVDKNNIQIMIPRLKVGNKVTITFKVEIRAFDSNNAIFNTVQIYDEKQLKNVIAEDNAIIKENQKDIIVRQIVDKDKAIKGDTLEYTIEVINNSHRIVKDHYVLDKLDTSLFKLDAGTIKVNGVSDITPEIKDNTIKVAFPSLGIGQRVTITFMVELLVFDSNNEVINVVQIFDPTYPEEPIDEEDRITKKDSDNLIIRKSVNKKRALVGDSLEYEIEIINNSDNDVKDYYIIDKLDGSQVNLDPGSIQVNGIEGATLDIAGNNIKVILPKLGSGEKASITFRVEIIAFNTHGDILTTVQIYESSNLDKLIGEDSAVTSEDFANVIIRKIVDKSSAVVDDTLEYTIEVINNGSSDVNNYYVIDRLDSKLVKLNVESIKVNGIEGIVPYVSKSTIKVTFPTLSVGARVTITYQVKVIRFDLYGNINDFVQIYDPSNQVMPISEVNIVTKASFAEVIIRKQVNEEYAYEGDTLKYTIEVINNTSSDIINYYVIDKLDATLVKIDEASIKINGLDNAFSVFDDNTIKVVFKTIRAGDNVKITFEAKIISFDINGVIPNVVQLFNPKSSDGPIAKADIVTKESTPKVSITKAVDKDIAQIGDELHYTVELVNSGTVSLTNCKLTDKFNQTLVKLNTSSVQFNSGDNIIPEVYADKILINIPKLAPGEKAILTFNVEIISFKDSGIITNTAHLFDPNNPDNSKDSNTVETRSHEEVDDNVTFDSVVFNNPLFQGLPDTGSNSKVLLTLVVFVFSFIIFIKVLKNRNEDRL